MAPGIYPVPETLAITGKKINIADEPVSVIFLLNYKK
jgi:hypothetical protein